MGASVPMVPTKRYNEFLSHVKLTMSREANITLKSGAAPKFMCFTMCVMR